MTLTEQVLAAIREAAETAILPRFRALQDGDIEEKSPGEVVTSADREGEALLTAALRKLRPDAIVIGEEATAANPRLLDAVDAPAAWLLDPLDGTSNFIAGRPEFAVMVALVQHGVTTHAWVWRPIDGEAWVAERGAGTMRNGERVSVPASQRSGLRGSVRTRFLDDEHRAFAEASSPRMGAEILPGSGCAGVDYPEIVLGNQDFVMFRRTLPWDHAPGALLLCEAGGVAGRWGGGDYVPGDGREGIIAARDVETWRAVARAMLLPRHREPATLD